MCQYIYLYIVICHVIFNNIRPKQTNIRKIPENYNKIT